MEKNTEQPGVRRTVEDDGGVRRFTTAELEEELERRKFVQEELGRRIYCGEIEATYADGVETMQNQDSYWR